MSNHRMLSLFAVASMAVASISCQDSTTEPDEPLTKQEALTMFTGIFETFFVSDAPVAPTSVSAAGAVYPCPLGGQATALLEESEELVAGVVPATTTITLDPDACGLPTAGSVFTLDGSPNLHFELNVSIGSTAAITLDGTAGGGLDWQFEDRSGTCAVDMTFSVVIGQPDTSEISGTACGHGPPFPLGETILRNIATSFGTGG